MKHLLIKIFKNKINNIKVLFLRKLNSKIKLQFLGNSLRKIMLLPLKLRDKKINERLNSRLKFSKLEIELIKEKKNFRMLNKKIVEFLPTVRP